MRWIAAFLFCLATTHVYAQQQNVVATFGDWRIERVEANNSYVLVGVGEVKGNTNQFSEMRFFDLQCYVGEHEISIMIPYGKYPQYRSKNPQHHRVTFWNDQGVPKEIEFILLKDQILVAFGGGKDRQMSEDVDGFIGVMEQAIKRFSFSFEAKSVHFDMTDFKPAWIRFRGLCGMK